MIDAASLGDLERRIVATYQGQTQKNLTGRLDDQIEKLLARIDSLEQGVGFLKTTQLADIPRRISDDADAIASQIRVKVSEAEDLQSLADSGLINEAESSLQSLLSELENSTTLAWREFVETNPIPNIKNRTAISTLSQSEQVKIQRLELLCRKLADAKTVPQTNDVESYTTALAYLRGIQEKVDATTIPPEVERFLSQAESDSGVPLKRMSKNIYDWIQSNNMMDRFVVRRP